MAREISGLTSELELLPWPASLRQALAPLQLYSADHLTSRTPDYRRKLRVAVSQLLSLSDEAKAQILDLNRLPTLPHHSLSLSHSPVGSRLLLGPQNWQLGVDVEEGQRLNREVIARVATAQEMTAAPRAELLFVCKEAGWKALNHKLGLKAMSQIETLHWRPIEASCWQFHIQIADQIVDGSGLCWEKQTHLSAIFAHQLNF